MKLFQAEEEIDQLNDTLQELNGKLEAIKGLKIQEEEEGSHYRMGHIKELSFDHRLVGRKGLRLKVVCYHMIRGGIPLQNGAHQGALF